MPDPSPTILAFDIGIRNLAWCLLRKGGQAQPQYEITGWQNYDLLAGSGHESTAAKQKTPCFNCSAEAKFHSPGPVVSCARHCPKSHPPLKDLSGGTPFKKLPGLPVLRTLAAAAAATAGTPPPKKTATRAALLEVLASRYSLPIEKLKLKKAVEHEITVLHDAIRKFVIANAENFRQATHILLENQPVLKNPTMKTVQILLFATLRDILQPGPPPLKLVHAGKKVKGKATGDAGYKSRKDASEEKVREILKGSGGAASGSGQVVAASEWLQHFENQAKQSDLADAFCMCWDAQLALRQTTSA